MTGLFPRRGTAAVVTRVSGVKPPAARTRRRAGLPRVTARRGSRVSVGRSIVAVALVVCAVCAVAILAGCATTNGANASASREAAPDYGLGMGIGDSDWVGPLELSFWGGHEMDALSEAQLDLFMYTLADFFLACREGGMENARVAGAADAVEFEDENTTMVFRLGWDLCAELGVDALEAAGVKETVYQRGREKGVDWYSNIWVNLEAKLLETLIPLIWRDDYANFLSIAMRWAGNSSYAILNRFEESPSWTGWGETVPWWAGEGELVPMTATETEGEWTPPPPTYATLNMIKQFGSIFSSIADFLVTARERGIANVDVTTVTFEGLESKYTTEYFRAGVALIQEGKGEAALEKLYFQTIARSGISYHQGIVEELLNVFSCLRSILDALAEDDPREGNASLGTFLWLADYWLMDMWPDAWTSSPDWPVTETAAAIAARFPGVTPIPVPGW